MKDCSRKIELNLNTAHILGHEKENRYNSGWYPLGHKFSKNKKKTLINRTDQKEKIANQLL